MKKFIYSLFITGIFLSCGSSETQNDSSSSTYKDALARMNQSFHAIVVDEVIESGSYSYIKYTQDGHEHWGAVARQPIEEGKTYYYQNAMEMKNFHSKSLDRIFPSIWFINDFSNVSPESSTQKSTTSDDLAQGHHTAKDVHQQIEVEKVAGGYSLAEVFKKKSELKDTEVLIRGQVVKLNENIMKTNWIHIQDGTSYNDLFDLTVTTNDQINFKVGDVITVKGKLVLNKDFGYGYKYDYLIEDAKIQ